MEPLFRKRIRFYPLMRVWRAGEWISRWKGAEVRVLSGDEDCLVVMVRVGAGGSVPVHSHEEAQYGVILKGRGVFQVDGREIEVREGDSYAIKSREPHGFKALEDTTVIDVFVPARSDYLPLLRKPDLE